MIRVMLQNEAKPVDQSTVELGSVAISGVVDTCSISTGDSWTEGTGKGIRGSNRVNRLVGRLHSLVHRWSMKRVFCGVGTP